MLFQRLFADMAVTLFRGLLHPLDPLGHLLGSPAVIGLHDRHGQVMRQCAAEDARDQAADKIGDVDVVEKLRQLRPLRGVGAEDRLDIVP